MTSMRAKPVSLSYLIVLLVVPLYMTKTKTSLFVPLSPSLFDDRFPLFPISPALYLFLKLLSSLFFPSVPFLLEFPLPMSFSSDLFILGGEYESIYPANHSNWTLDLEGRCHSDFAVRIGGSEP